MRTHSRSHGDLNRLWLRGGFPRSFLARTEAASSAWREDFIRTFLERDLAQLGVRVPSGTMRRFWTMTAHYSGGIWNSSEIGRSLGEAHTTVKRHLDALSGALVVRVQNLANQLYRQSAKIRKKLIVSLHGHSI